MFQLQEPTISNTSYLIFIQIRNSNGTDWYDYTLPNLAHTGKMLIDWNRSGELGSLTLSPIAPRETTVDTFSTTIPTQVHSTRS